MTDVNRRTLLASLPAGAAASIAGCSDWTTAYLDISLKPVDHTEFTTEMTKGEDDLIPSSFIETLVATLIDGVSIELEILEDFRIFERQSSDAKPLYYWTGAEIYQLNREVLDGGGVTGPEYEVSRVHRLPEDVSPEDDDEILSFSDLPLYDQWRLHDTFKYQDGQLIHFTGSTIVGYLDAERKANSILLGGVSQRFLEVNDKYLELEVGKAKTTTAEQIRVSAEQFATDERTFTERILGEHAIDATSMSNDVQDLLADIQENDGSISLSDEESGFAERKETVEQLESKREEVNELATREMGLYIRYDEEYYLLSWRSHVAP